MILFFRCILGSAKGAGTVVRNSIAGRPVPTDICDAGDLNDGKNNSG
jgi:hypothetical protein